jgi:crossover junction endodeoxyribonuclease RuvC
MLVLGVDPGTAITGYGLVRQALDGDQLEAVAYGVIITPSDWAMPERLQRIYRDLTLLIREHHPTEAAVEQLFFSRNVKTALAVGQARGVVLLALADGGLPVREYTPLEVKQSVVGYGRAEKAQVQELVRLLLGLDAVPRPDDAADALAIAICHLHSARMDSLLRRAG